MEEHIADDGPDFTKLWATTMPSRLSRSTLQGAPGRQAGNIRSIKVIVAYRPNAVISNRQIRRSTGQFPFRQNSWSRKTLAILGRM
jgi:hypothetical protein